MTISYNTSSPSSAEDIQVCLREDGIIKISGPDAERFLQGQLSCDVRKAAQDKLIMGAHCNPQGRVISLFYLYSHEDAYFLIMPRDLIPIATAALKKYSVFFRVEIKDISADKMIIGITKLPEKTNISQFILLSLPFASSRWILIGEREREIEARFSSATMNLNSWKCININEGISSIYAATSGLFLPHEINLPQLGAINFDKGCYTGQEIIARMHYRGKLKKQMYHASIKSTVPLIPGQIVYSRVDNQIQIAGHIVDSCQYPHHDIQHALIILNHADAINQHLFLEEHQDVFFTID